MDLDGGGRLLASVVGGAGGLGERVEGALRTGGAEELANRPDGSESLGQVELLAEVLGGAVREQDPKARDALGDGSVDAALSEVLVELLAEGVGGNGEESGARLRSEGVNEQVALAKSWRGHDQVGARASVEESCAKASRGFLGGEKPLKVGVLLLEELAKEREVREQDAVELRKPETEFAQLRNRKVSEGASSGLASLLHHAVGVLPAAGAPCRGAHDASGAVGIVASGAKGPAERPGARIHAALEPARGRHSGERFHELLVGLVVGRNFPTRLGGAWLGGFGGLGSGGSRARRPLGSRPR